MSEAKRDPFVGKTLNGRFELEAVLGGEGRSRVYRATQHPLDRPVAVKVLNPRADGSSDPDFEDRFFIEAVMAAKLKHPNTISLHDFGRTVDGIYFIAMELFEGETLQRVLLQDGPMTWPRALSMGAQVARSLKEAHRHGLIHGDLSPTSIMLAGEGPAGDMVKVLNFGQARKVDGPAYRVTGARGLELTQAGAALGSFLYMAPERARFERDPRSDVYSLGALLYFALAGRPPFVGPPLEVIAKHLRERPAELASIAEVPEPVSRLVMRCLEKVPEARFPSAGALLDAICDAAASQGVTGVFLSRGPTPPPYRTEVPVPPPLPSASRRGVRRVLVMPLRLWRSARQVGAGGSRTWWRRLSRRSRGPGGV